MFSVYIEMPLGNHSPHHDFSDEMEARSLFDSFVRQMTPWKKFQTTVIMRGGGKLTTVDINNA